MRSYYKEISLRSTNEVHSRIDIWLLHDDSENDSSIERKTSKVDSWFVEKPVRSSSLLYNNMNVSQIVRLSYISYLTPVLETAPYHSDLLQHWKASGLYEILSLTPHHNFRHWAFWYFVERTNEVFYSQRRNNPALKATKEYIQILLLKSKTSCLDLPLFVNNPFHLPEL